MKKLLLIASLALLFGCTSTNPAYSPPPAGQTSMVPPYIVNPQLNAISNTVAQAAGALAPVNPYAGLTDLAVKGVFGLIGLVTGGVLAFKNQQGVVNSMASSVVSAGAHAAVLDQASNTPQYSAIASAINNALAPNQNPSGKV